MRKLLFALLLLSTSCVVGPKYTRPSVPTAPAYKELETAGQMGEWKPSQPSDVAARGKWWLAFNDPSLSELEEKLNNSNQNIVAAAANVQIARALVREARAQYFPTVAADPSIVNSRISTGLGKQLGISYTTESLPLEASWEPDLFGRVRNTVLSATLSAQASVADLENVRLAAQTDLAGDYYQLRFQDALIRLYESTAVAYKDAFDIARDRYSAGVDSEEPAAQAETQWKITRAQATNLRVLRAQYEHAIALLIGQPASSFSLAPDVATPVSPVVPTGLPSQLLERRPDIASSERAVASANAQIGIARSAFFPVLTLAGSAGLQSITFANWFAWPSRIWSVGPTLAQVIFDAGLRKATVQQYQAAYDQTVANYRQTVLTAFQQVEDNLAALRTLKDVIHEEDAAIESAQRSLDEASIRYKSGLDPYLNVITAQTTLLAAQQSAVSFRLQQILASVQLIKALGGGWDAAQVPSAKELAMKH